MTGHLKGFIAIFTGVLAFSLAAAGCAKKEDKSASIPSPVSQGVQAKQPEAQKEVPVPSTKPITEERVIYDFEGDLLGFEIPVWAQGKADYVAKEVVVSNEFAKNGASSLKVTANFTGDNWNAALVEIQQYLDLSQYRVISVDFFIPKEAPIGLKGMMILTVGDNWKFVEMNRSVPLIPGEWVTLTASIEPGSYDWKRIVPDENFAQDVRKIAIRVESNKKPQYSGPVYIDNIRVGK
jgi:hypothetical protein